MGERVGSPPQPESHGGAPAADSGDNHPVCTDGGTKDEGPTTGERSDRPTPPATLNDEHVSLIREQPTDRLADWAIYCYRLAAVGKQTDRDEQATKPETVPQPYADRIQFMKKRHLRGMAAHSLALLGAGIDGFDLGTSAADQLPEVERRAKLYEWIERKHRGRRVEKNVPAHASITQKEIGSGDDESKAYFYWQYRTDGSSTSDYICAVSSTPFDTPG